MAFRPAIMLVITGFSVIIAERDTIMRHAGVITPATASGPAD